MYAALQTGIVEFLEAEEDFFGLPIIADALPNTEKTVSEWLQEKGAVLVVGRPRQQRNGPTEVRVEVPLVFLENEVINNGTNGVAMDGEQLAVNLIYSLDGYTMSFWTPFNARPFAPKDTEFGLNAVGCMVETKTLLVRDFACLCTHTGALLVDHSENGRALLTTNRGKQY